MPVIMKGIKDKEKTGFVCPDSVWSHIDVQNLLLFDSVLSLSQFSGVQYIGHVSASVRLYLFPVSLAEELVRRGGGNGEILKGFRGYFGLFTQSRLACCLPPSSAPGWAFSFVPARKKKKKKAQKLNMIQNHVSQVINRCTNHTATMPSVCISVS